MSMARKIKLFIPFVILIFLVVILWRELANPKPREVSSALINNAIPPFRTSQLLQAKKMFAHENLRGQVSLLNFWASWCYACRAEMPMLMEIHKKYAVPIYGINYKDEPADAKKWLQQYGNPYKVIGTDQKGDIAIDFGIYGIPETFVVSPDGKILYRHAGMINQAVWDEQIYPVIKKYERKS